LARREQDIGGEYGYTAASKTTAARTATRRRTRQRRWARQHGGQQDNGGEQDLGGEQHGGEQDNGGERGNTAVSNTDGMAFLFVWVDKRTVFPLHFFNALTASSEIALEWRW
jgi:hypothetical protein